VAGRAAAHMPDPFSMTLALGVPWLVVSFAAGFATKDLALGTLAGAGVLMLSVLAYYAVVRTAGAPEPAGYRGLRNSSSPARASRRTLPCTIGVQPSASPTGPRAWRAQA
jgi:hypothetical protein